MLPFQRIFSFTIVAVSVSNYSDDTINISLTTEAVELYYFQSWQYTVSETTITIEACFVPGFGSTIAYLNTNFQLPTDSLEHRDYHLIVKAYYEFYTPENLQDSEEGMFAIPLMNTVVLTNSTFSDDAFFPNPTSGKLFFDNKITSISIYDVTGKKVAYFSTADKEIDISNKPESLYFIEYFRKSHYKVIRIILRK
jgi:hypothetical protein